MKKSKEWKKYGVCPCGFKTESPYDLFYISMDECPTCGESKDKWVVVTGRWAHKRNVNRKWFNPTTWRGTWDFEVK